MLDLGLQLAVDARTVCFVEREIPSAEILAARMRDGLLEDAPIWSDLRTFDGRPWCGLVDIVAGGIPCQPFSVAGTRAGNDDERALAPHLLRIVGECLPSLVFVENVPPWVSRGYARDFLVGLSDLGYRIARPFFSRASAFGAPHKRERVFVMAYREGGDGRLQLRQRGPQEARVELEGGGEGMADTASERCEWTGEPWEGRSGFKDLCETVGDSHSARLEGRINNVGPRFIRAWPPGPTADWSRIPERLWPATTQPVVRRMADGHSPRVDRLRACGNGVVPIVAAHAFLSLMESLK